MIQNSESRLQNSRFRESGTREEFSWQLYVELYENALEAVHFENSCTFIYKCMYDILPCCTTFLRSPVRKLSGCDPHFRAPHGVALTPVLRGPRAWSRISVCCSRISQNWSQGYSVGRARAEFTEHIRKSNGIREQCAKWQNPSPMRQSIEWITHDWLLLEFCTLILNSWI